MDHASKRLAHYVNTVYKSFWSTAMQLTVMNRIQFTQLS